MRQAGYVLRSTAVATSPSGAFAQHFVSTRHGIVARTWIGPDFVQVVLRRPANSGGTYQGSVRAVPGGWQAFDDFIGPAQPFGPVHRNYLDAEAQLLRQARASTPSHSGSSPIARSPLACERRDVSPISTNVCSN